MAKANINTVRLWGGGIYESEEFFDLADRYGILIWHDLMFACALYPTASDYVQNVREEVKQQV